MTRVDIIPAEQFHNKHIVSGNREIKRIPNKILNGKYVMGVIPETYRMGTGHEKFFVNKIKYLHEQYKKIYAEGIKRGFNLTDFSGAFEQVAKLHPELYNDWKPSEKDLIINRQRIQDRIQSWSL